MSSRVQCCKRQKAGASSEATGNMIGWTGTHCKESGLSRCCCKETTARRSPVGKEISGYVCSS